MKKILIFIYIVSFTVTAVSSQESYHLDKVVLTATDYNTKSVVFVKNLNDSIEILSSDWDFPILPVFKTVSLADNVITSVEIVGDGRRYNVDAQENLLLLTEDLSRKKDELLVDDEKVIESLNGYQLPNYTIEQSGNEMIITFDLGIYGSSKYSGKSLVGKCQMIYVKY